jgi:hypothetical protein
MIYSCAKTTIVMSRLTAYRTYVICPPRWSCLQVAQLIWYGPAFLLKIEGSVLLKKLRELRNQSLKTDGFVVDCSWDHGVSGNWFERAESRTRQEIMRTCASYWEDSGGPEEAFVLPDCNDWFLQVGTLASPPALLFGGDDAVEPHTVQEKLLPHWILISLPFRIFWKLFMTFNISFFFFSGQNRLFRTTLPFLTLHLWENMFRLMSPVSEPPTS